MTKDWKRTLGSILESGGQTHLSVYLENSGDLGALKNALQSAIFDAKDVLIPAMPEEEIRRFLAPLEALLREGSALSGLSGNVAIFRSRDLFRVLGIPTPVKPGCHVASTFHVKPLLAWLQLERDYVVVGLGRDAAHLAVCGPSSFKAVDVIGYSVGGASLDDSEPIDFDWIWAWIRAVLPLQGKPVLVVGSGQLVEDFLSAEERRGAEVFHLDEVFDDGIAESTKSRLQAFARDHARSRMQALLRTFRSPKAGRKIEMRIQSIARAALGGKVETLLVAEDRELFGRIHPRSGEVAIHPFDLDHEDDDLLDDLAQKVLLAGGEVLVASRAEIPGQRSILAMVRAEAELRAARDIRSWREVR